MFKKTCTIHRDAQCTSTHDITLKKFKKKKKMGQGNRVFFWGGVCLFLSRNIQLGIVIQCSILPFFSKNYEKICSTSEQY